MDTTQRPRLDSFPQIPPGVSNVLILGMDAHMDWDWLNTFQELVYQGNGSPAGSVKTIIQDAWNLMEQNPPGAGAPYMYSVCETGFVRAVLELEPQLLQQFQQKGLSQQLDIEGGGITSPDNLLPHGEAFIRCYLLGRNWIRENLGLSSSFAYLPDDFGHDSQLPVVLEAMGLAGVSFSRLPGSWASSQTSPLDGSPSLYDELIGGSSPQGAEVFWLADDGSSALAHVLQSGYQQGNGLADAGTTSDAVSLIQGYYDFNKPSSPTPYVYVPCGNDFAIPIADLLSYAAAYNQQRTASDPYCVVGTLQQYFEHVLAWSQQNPNQLHSRPMSPTPYWTGFYASRPENKILHHATVRGLLGAEVFSVVAKLLQAGTSTSTSDSLAWAPVEAALESDLNEGWEALLPSTHHDYVTGTAVDSVTTEEQVPLLRAALANAEGARATAVQSIATLIGLSASASAGTPVLALNPLGFERQGLASIERQPGQAFQSVSESGGGSFPVQQSADGKWLFPAKAPAFGYDASFLSAAPPSGTFADAVSVTVSPAGDSVTIGNAQVRVTLSKSLGWAIIGLQAVVNGTPGDNLVQQAAGANALTFYYDQGNIYNFGNESGDSSQFALRTGTLTAQVPRVLEQGPLRGRVEADITFTDQDGSSADYTLGYTLVAGESCLRMSITGSAPLPTSPSGTKVPYAVTVRFPFASAGAAVKVDGVLHGTPYHWTDELPKAYWQGPTFQATHDFVVPTLSGQPLAALYHSDIPAWAIDDGGAMIGCVLRNTPGTFPWPDAFADRGANGVDFGVHTHHYAIRIPNGLALPPTGAQVLEESLAVANPLATGWINTPSDPLNGGSVTVSFPETYALAAVQSGHAVLTVAKLGTNDPKALILRIYQPTNATETVAIDLSGYIEATGIQSPKVVPVSALEEPLQGAQPLSVANGIVTVSMHRALITLQVSPQ